MKVFINAGHGCLGCWIVNHIWHSNEKKMQYSIFQICNFSFYESIFSNVYQFVSEAFQEMLTYYSYRFRGISSLKIGDKPNWTTPEKWNWTFMTWICVFWSFFLSSHFEYRKFQNIEYSNQANPRISRVAGRQVVPGLSRARYFQKWTFLSWVCSILVFFSRIFEVYLS